MFKDNTDKLLTLHNYIRIDFIRSNYTSKKINKNTTKCDCE